MNDVIRPCPDCGRDRPLAQLHAAAGKCPDSADTYCPEWYCQLCGAALVIGEAPAAWLPVGAGGVPARVA